MNRVVYIAIVILTAARCSVPEPEQPTFPRHGRAGIEQLFQKYSCEIQAAKMLVPLDQTSFKEWRLFRTRITEASRKPVNFAGKYIVVEWGCGTACQSGAIIDATTGKIKALPTSEWGREYRQASRLLIINPPADQEPGRERPEYAYPAYYAWQNDEFKLLRDTRKLAPLDPKITRSF